MEINLKQIFLQKPPRSFQFDVNFLRSPVLLILTNVLTIFHLSTCFLKKKKHDLA